jgi:hypothetical protein
MIKNCFKIAWRNLGKSKMHSFINVGGLSIGMAVVMLVGLWVYDELSFNKYHQNYDRIAQIMTRGSDAKDGPYVNNSVQYPLAIALQNDYKDNFKQIIKASWIQDYILSAGDKKLSAMGQFMDAGAPEMFTLNMLKGSRSGLDDPYSIMLSASVTRALFGNDDPIGKTVMLSNTSSVKVTGVY